MNLNNAYWNTQLLKIKTLQLQTTKNQNFINLITIPQIKNPKFTQIKVKSRKETLTSLSNLKQVNSVLNLEIQLASKWNHSNKNTYKYIYMYYNKFMIV